MQNCLKNKQIFIWIQLTKWTIDVIWFGDIEFRHHVTFLVWTVETRQSNSILNKVICPKIKRGTGCERCGNTGYRGRVGLYEFLLMSDAIRHHIANDADANVIRDQAIAEGMQTLREDALEKLKAGLTTPEEVFRVTRSAWI